MICSAVPTAAGRPGTVLPAEFTICRVVFNADILGRHREAGVRSRRNTDFMVISGVYSGR